MPANSRIKGIHNSVANTLLVQLPYLQSPQIPPLALLGSPLGNMEALRSLGAKVMGGKCIKKCLISLDFLQQSIDGAGSVWVLVPERFKVCTRAAV